MLNNIKNKLLESSEQHKIKILYACESGSRAWGFASPDSDFDIRFVYQHSFEWYLTLWEKKDTIEFFTDDNLDGSGWDLAKTLRLLAKSNATLLEWIFSPIQYLKEDTFFIQLQELAKEAFSPVACMYHYLSMSKNFVPEIQQEKIKLKSYFYALRTVLAGKWIVKQNSFPPVLFEDLLQQTPNNIQDQIRELIEIKAQQDEKYLHPKTDFMQNFLLENLAFNESYAKTLPAGKK